MDGKNIIQRTNLTQTHGLYLLQIYIGETQASTHFSHDLCSVSTNNQFANNKSRVIKLEIITV